MSRKLPLRMVKAAAMIAEERLSQQDIAKKLGLSEYALSRWKRKYPEFRELIGRYRTNIAEEALNTAIARKDVRISKLNKMHAKIERIIDKRAEDAVNNPTFVGVAGADTGLIVHDRKCIGGAQFGEMVDVFAVDTELIKRHDSILEQVAKEKGEFEPDKSPKGDQHQHVHIHYPTLTDGENAAAVQAMQADMPPAARRLLTRPSDGKPLDR